MSADRMLAAIVVLVLAGVAHGAGVSGGWVYDDHRFVEQNPSLDQMDVAAFFRDPATASSSKGIQHDIYRPLRTLHYAAETAVFGRDAPKPFHLGNLLLHAIASLLVLALALGLLGGRTLFATVAAALFAVHPVAVESVAWISSRGDLLAVVFMLLSLLVMARRGTLRTVLGVALAFLAFFSKESALVLPALLFLRDVGLPRDRRLPWRTTLVRTGLLCVAVGLYFVVRLQVIPGLAQVGDFPGGSRAAASRGMLAGLVWYVQALVWPTGFPFDLQIPVPARWTDPVVVVGLGLLASLLLAGAFGLKRRTALAFATLGALACLVPVSNVLIPLKALVAERFLYPVLVCFAVGIAWGIARLPRLPRALALVAVLPALAGLLVVSRDRTRAWESDQVLWERVLQDRPGHVRAYEGLGFEYLRAGRIRDAEIAYRSYLEANPIDGKGMVLLGDAFGNVARGLRLVRAQPGESLEGEGREWARRFQIALYEDALKTWERIGLVQGRGDPELRRRVYRTLMDAAYDISNYGKVAWANDRLLALHGLDPQDTETVLARAPFDQRRTRLNLALEVLTRQDPARLSPAQREQRQALRGLLLRQAGVPPSLGQLEALDRLRGRYEALVRDPEAGLREHLNLAILLETLGRKASAEDVVARARARWPDDPIWRGPQ